MPVEYNAIALGLVGLMFFLLEFGSRVNFQVSGKGLVDINDIAKTVFVIMSVVVGIGLTLFMQAVSAGNTGAIDAVLVTTTYFWIFVTCFVLLLFTFYFISVIPRLFDKGKKDD